MLWFLFLQSLVSISAVSDTEWGSWSPWSPCSRSCGGGVQTRGRVCVGKDGCEGPVKVWRVCELHPCPDPHIDWLDQQCARFNNKPYEGKYHLWASERDWDSPCALNCWARDTPSLVARLADRMEDGTSCSNASLKVCLNGRCEEVGCDLELRSEALLDQCGVCGGDGSSCSGDKYEWREVPLSRCSASCGGGTRMARSICRNKQDNNTVDDGMCDQATRPSVRIAPCNTRACPARWETSSWVGCPMPCSGGLRTRTVQCVSDKNATRILIAEENCPGSKPASEESCNSPDCPVWHKEIWSGCSVTCGEGTQHRSVTCLSVDGQPSTDCGGSRPRAVQTCHRRCSPDIRPPLDLASPSGWKRMEDVNITDLPPVTQRITPTDYIATTESPPSFRQEALASQSGKKVSLDPNFIIGAWSACSASCGEGIRRRRVECKIFLEFSKTVATLPDRECPGLKPPETEICVDRMQCGPHGIMADTVGMVLSPGENKPASLPLTVADERQESYSWKISGYTTCTASCLGGVQESIVICVETRKEQPVAPYFCDPNNRLDIEVRTCNDEPCPPRWNVSDFTPCTKSCGGGIQTRAVACIQEVAHGGSNVITLDNTECPQPPPTPQQFCSVVDCTAAWHTQQWTKCSKKCGRGFRFRKVGCQQMLALGQLIDKPESLCQGLKPEIEEVCNTNVCPIVREPKIRANSDQEYVQKDPNQTVVKLKVGGKATVFEGATLKIRCPVKRYDKRKISWYKGDQYYLAGKKRNKHSKAIMTRKGQLRIKNIGYSDSGTYSCKAAKSTAKIEIYVKENPTKSVDNPKGRKKDRIWLNSVETFVTKVNDVLQGGKTPSTFKRRFDVTTESSGNRLGKYDTSRKGSRKASGSKKNRIDKGDRKKNPHKWNYYRENERDYDKIYWDSIDNHVAEDEAVGGKKRKQKTAFSIPRKMRLKIMSQVSSSEEMLDDEKSESSETPLSWKKESWSVCSKSCGGGHQTRSITCVIKLTERNVTQQVPENFCEGIKAPQKRRRCAKQECPRWKHSPWMPCPKADCHSRNTGLRTRTVNCVVSSKVVADNECDVAVRPGDSQPCHNQECIGIWVLGEWSQCSSSCGRGERRRRIWCEWLKGGSAPRQECNLQDHPPTTVDCYGPPCRDWPLPLENALENHHNDPDDDIQHPQIVVSPLRDGRDTSSCQDKAKFCRLIKTFKMCSDEKFSEQCCRTCHTE